MPTLNLAKLVVKLVSDTDEYEKGLNKAEQKTSGFGKAVGAAAVAGFAVAGAAATKFAADSINEFNTFEKGMAEVFTLLPGISAEAMGSMQGDVLDFAMEAGRTTDEVIPALYQAISAGVPQENVFDFMKIASDAALGGVTDLETAVDGITSAVNAYGSEALSAQEASDLMFTAVMGGKTTFEELSAALFQVNPIAAALGVEFGNVTAALAAMTSQGVPTSVATTQLRQLLMELSKEGSAAAAVFEQMAGQSFQQFIASGGNLQDALQLMEQAAADNGVALQDMFSSVEAGGAALALTGEGTGKFTAELENAADAAGATEAAAATMSETGVQAMAEMQAAVEALKIMVGEELAPAMTEFVVAATRGIKQVADQITVSHLEQRLRDVGGGFFGIGNAATASIREMSRVNNKFLDGEKQARLLTLAILDLTNGFDGSLSELEDYILAQDAANQRADAATDYYTDLYGATVQAAEGTEDLTAANQGAAGPAADLADKYAQQANMLSDAAVATRDHQAALVAQAEAETAAAEAALALEAAQREVNARMGEYFVESLPAIENTDSLEQQLLQAASAADAGAGELLLLAAATGDYTEAELQAALKAAIFQETMGRVAEAVANGTLSVGDAITIMYDLQDTLSRDYSMEIETNAEEAAAGLSVADQMLAEKLGVFEESADTTSTGIQGTLENLTNAVQTSMDAVATIIDARTGESFVTTDEAMANILGSTEMAMGGVVGAVEANMPQVAVKINAALGQAEAEAQAFVPEFTEVGAMMAWGMVAGVQSGAGALANATASIVFNALAAAEAAAGTSSPSWKTYAIMDDFVQGGVDALEDRGDAWAMAVADAAGGAVDQIGAAANTAAAAEISAVVPAILLPGPSSTTGTAAAVSSEKGGLAININLYGPVAGDREIKKIIRQSLAEAGREVDRVIRSGAY